ncbi:hypothetical protein HOT94_gp062 [Gordonia phage Phistory]|uniref:Uncharacterized protein n=1 Tax=Gordonia phage Phistory TaxID=2301694 RepID=A0A385E1I0_9CAUD|nr:hypothetical protein HOT94_gp062 [Gordonia phage Phistory]AXQ64767.1 hypothetical protein SEA_PHISTORY_62 [Gordonia phage Phistory]
MTDISDPAVDAAKRMWENGPASEIEFRPDEDGLLAAVAREALKPLRDLHYPSPVKTPVFNGDGTFIGEKVVGMVCKACTTPHQSGHCDYCEVEGCEGVLVSGGTSRWPCATAKLIYTSDELAGDS